MFSALTYRGRIWSSARSFNQDPGQVIP